MWLEPYWACETRRGPEACTPEAQCREGGGGDKDGSATPAATCARANAIADYVSPQDGRGAAARGVAEGVKVAWGGSAMQKQPDARTPHVVGPEGFVAGFIRVHPAHRIQELTEPRRDNHTPHTAFAVWVIHAERRAILRGFTHIAFLVLCQRPHRRLRRFVASPGGGDSVSWLVGETADPSRTRSGRLGVCLPRWRAANQSEILPALLTGVRSCYVGCYRCVGPLTLRT